MEKYDSVKLEKYKHDLLRIYINDLELLQEDKIPISFGEHIN